MVAQVALSVLLLSAAVLFVGHLLNLRHLDLGFHPDHVLLVTLDPEGSGYDDEHLSLAYQGLLVRLEAIPGVRSATICAPSPISGAGANRESPSRDIRPSRERSATSWRVGSRRNTSQHSVLRC